MLECSIAATAFASVSKRTRSSGRAGARRIIFRATNRSSRSLARLVDDPHSTRAEHLQNLVTGDSRSRTDHGTCRAAAAYVRDHRVADRCSSGDVVSNAAAAERLSDMLGVAKPIQPLSDRGVAIRVARPLRASPPPDDRCIRRRASRPGRAARMSVHPARQESGHRSCWFEVPACSAAEMSAGVTRLLLRRSGRKSRRLGCPKSIHRLSPSVPLYGPDRRSGSGTGTLRARPVSPSTTRTKTAALHR